ncbi:hypothetical protein Fmac_019366 [Flemingia macrophylla]|uniref:Uncharacterized protein n=1 Tax=Flemingia macrophylla TaxID=520843 RepID=A0ABD1M7K5_9FABA
MDMGKVMASDNECRSQVRPRCMTKTELKCTLLHPSRRHAYSDVLHRVADQVTRNDNWFGQNDDNNAFEFRSPTVFLDIAGPVFSIFNRNLVGEGLFMIIALDSVSRIKLPSPELFPVLNFGMQKLPVLPPHDHRQYKPLDNCPVTLEQQVLLTALRRASTHKAKHNALCALNWHFSVQQSAHHQEISNLQHQYSENYSITDGTLYDLVYVYSSYPHVDTKGEFHPAKHHLVISYDIRLQSPRFWALPELMLIHSLLKKPLSTGLLLEPNDSLNTENRNKAMFLLQETSGNNLEEIIKYLHPEKPTTEDSSEDSPDEDKTDEEIVITHKK